MCDREKEAIVCALFTAWGLPLAETWALERYIARRTESKNTTAEWEGLKGKRRRRRKKKQWLSSLTGLPLGLWGWVSLKETFGGYRQKETNPSETRQLIECDGWNKGSGAVIRYWTFSLEGESVCCKVYETGFAGGGFKDLRSRKTELPFTILWPPRLELQGHLLQPCPRPPVMSFYKNDTWLKTFTPLRILLVAALPLPACLSGHPAHKNNHRGPHLNNVNTHRQTNTGSSPSPVRRH